MNRDPLPSLHICLNELLHEEKCSKTQVAMEQQCSSSGSLNAAYVVQRKGKGRDICSVLEL